MDPVILATRLAEVMAQTWPDAGIEVAASGSEVVLRWEDGPASGVVATTVAEVVNWPLRGAAGPPGQAGTPAVVLDRRFSAEALAVAVVRYQASHVRPYHSGDEAAVHGLVELLERDDPARSGYPVPDAMAELLLAAPDPPDLDDVTGPEPSPADRLAAKLTALGYDRLWHVAWAGIG